MWRKSLLLLLLWSCGGGGAGLEKKIETLETNVSELRHEVIQLRKTRGEGGPTTGDSNRWWYCVASNPFAGSEAERAKGDLTAFTTCFRKREECESMLTVGSVNCIPAATAWCPPAGSKSPCTFHKDLCGPDSLCKREAP